MPRIDPERLLRCLHPLLDSCTGAIRSSEEVDKILGLMSKFSKKLVSKCIYINILKSTHPEVLDSFMIRGGWTLIFGWANEGVTTKNFPLLKEVLELLVITPTDVPRLKESRFPLLVKGLSKDCEVLEIKNLAKQVVSKWIAIVKTEESQLAQSVQLPVLGADVGLSTGPSNLIQDHNIVPADLGSLAMNSNDPLLNIDPTLITTDAENQLMDLDISHTDLANIDFNLDILSKVVDQQNLDENLGGVTSNNSVNVPIPQLPEDPHHLLQTGHSEINSNMVLAPPNVIVNPPAPVAPVAPMNMEQVQPQIVSEEVYRMIPVQQTPKLFIKTVAGQRTVVQNFGEESRSTYLMVIKDGKNVLMKIKEPTQVVAPLVIQQGNANTEVPSGPVIQKSQDVPDATEANRVKSIKKELPPPPVTTKIKVPGDASLKTYSTKSKPSTDKTSTKKVSDLNIKPSHKSEKDKEKKTLKEKSNTNEIPKKSKSSSSSNSKSAQAAAAAKLQAEEDKLREEIRKQKALVKKRAKEAELQKQVEKDQETLKKLNLVPSTSPSSSLKIPKIPRKHASFADAIGIPGSDGISTADKIKKVAEKATSKIAEDNSVPTSPTKKFYGKKEEPESLEDDKPKERRHKPKVFVSSKSRSDDLLKEMTESGKSKSNKDKKEKEEKETKPNATLGNSIPAVPPISKSSKRLSTDTVEKPGDAKKAKLSDTTIKVEKDSKPKEKDGKDKDKESPKDKEKEKEKKKPVIALKESSLFMDMLTASSETSKPSKRKRRPSTGGEKDKAELISPIEKLQKSLSKEDDESSSSLQDTVSTTPDEPVKKPVFNFYRDTLNDEEDKNDEDSKQSSADKEESEDVDQSTDSGSFTPQEGDGKIKSALCLHRAKNRPRKTVRWREEDELREFHFFEMDETERVNVTKQKEFTELSQHERMNERLILRRKAEEDKESSSPWKLPKIDFAVEPLKPLITSIEKNIQEERENNVLGLFLPPGSTLPDAPVEADPADAIGLGDRGDHRIIPLEDVNTVTKMCDFRTHGWPAPKGSMVMAGVMPGYGGMKDVEDNSRLNPAVNTFPTGNDYNPWNQSLGFNAPPPTAPTGIPNIDMPFPPFPIPPPGGMNMNLLNTGQPPPVPLGFATPNPFVFPPNILPPMNGPPPGVIDSFGGNHDGRMGMQNRGSRFNDTDQRRNFHGRDREGNNRGNGRDRDFRDDRGGRDRDYRRRDRDNNDRDYRHYDRDRNNRDFGRGSGRGIRKDIPCKFFKKGFCHMGNRCEFMHDGSNNHEDTRNNTHSRQDNFESGRSRRSPDTNTGSKDVDFRNSSAPNEDWESPSEPSTHANDVSSTRFAQPPSSPTEPEIMPFAASSESTKVIPV